jgi:hypothetical protein
MLPPSVPTPIPEENPAAQRVPATELAAASGSHGQSQLASGSATVAEVALGRFLHHTPAEAMLTPQNAQEGIRRAWRLACGLENISARTPPRLPLIFKLDDRLNIPDGFRYSLNCLAAAAQALGELGALTGASDHGVSKRLLTMPVLSNLSLIP